MGAGLLAALLGAGTSAIQAIWGGRQLKKAQQLEDQYPRPVAQTSEAIKKLLGYSYARTMDQDIPGGELYRNEIKGATSAGLSAAKQLGSGSEAYGMLGQLVGREQGAMTELAKAVAQQQYNARGNYMDVLAGPAYQEERRVDYWNKEMPYLQAAERAMQLREAGPQNIMSGIRNVAGVVSAAAQPDLYSALYGNEKNNQGEIGGKELQAILDRLLKRKSQTTGGTTFIDSPVPTNNNGFQNNPYIG